MSNIDLILTREGYEKIMEAHNDLVIVQHGRPNPAEVELQAYHNFAMKVMEVLRTETCIEPLKEYVL